MWCCFHQALPDPERFKWKPWKPLSVLKNLVGPTSYKKYKGILLTAVICLMFVLIVRHSLLHRLICSFVSSKEHSATSPSHGLNVERCLQVPMMFSSLAAKIVSQVSTPPAHRMSPAGCAVDLCELVLQGPLAAFESCDAGLVEAGNYFKSQCTRSDYSAEFGLPCVIRPEPIGHPQHGQGHTLPCRLIAFVRWAPACRKAAALAHSSLQRGSFRPSACAMRRRRRRTIVHLTLCEPLTDPRCFRH